jgi:hypothetical protein
LKSAAKIQLFSMLQPIEEIFCSFFLCIT